MDSTDLDITIHKGSTAKPVVIFIHGLGMDKDFWLDPMNTKVFAKNIPMKVFAAKKPRARRAEQRVTMPTVGTIPDKITSLWDSVIDRGFNAICWSQSRPVGPISVAIDELDHIVSRAQQIFPGHPIAFVCHSRGGLVARKLMEKNIADIKALITIASPHRGSALPVIGKYLAPLKPAIENLLPRRAHGTAAEVLKRVGEFLEGTALRELIPESVFLTSLKDRPRNDVHYLSFGGTATTLVRLYSWKKSEDKRIPSELLTIPDSLLKVLPVSIIPDEITPGKGDVMVSAASSVLPWGNKHIDLQANHISIVWNKKTINHTIEVLEAI